MCIPMRVCTQRHTGLPTGGAEELAALCLPGGQSTSLRLPGYLKRDELGPRAREGLSLTSTGLLWAGWPLPTCPQPVLEAHLTCVLSLTGKMESALFTQNFQKHLGKKASQKPETTKLPGRPKSSFSTYNQE